VAAAEGKPIAMQTGSHYRRATTPYEGLVVNGYWLLLDLDVDGIDRFETVSVLDQSGKVLHRFDRSAVVR